MVKKTVNQDDPSVYHLFYADELGSGGADLTFFEYPGATPGRAGPGMVNRILTRVASSEALDFWADRLGSEGVATERSGDQPFVRRSRGHGARARRRRSPRRAADRASPRDPARVRAAGLRGRARLEHAARLEPPDARGGARVRAHRGSAGRRAARRAEAPTPTTRCPTSAACPGAGTVHHIAWASTYEDHEAWGERVRELGPAPDAGDRPLLLPLDLLPRARRRALRDRDARARASRSTSRWSRSASTSRCRRRSSTCASASSRC